MMPTLAIDIQPGLIEDRRLPLRPWMPPHWRRALAGARVDLRVSDPVRLRCRRPKRILPSEYSRLFRRMPDSDSHPGKWRVEFARQSVKVMDTWALPWVREVWFCGVDQMSKTNTMIGCIQWSIEHAPGNIFYQMPDEASSSKIMDSKINGGLRATPRMAKYLSPRADDTGLAKTTLVNGVTILPAWSGSPSSTAIFSALYTFTDELDKCKMVGKEASPVARIKKRTRNKKFGKHFFAGTPAGQWLYKETTACVQVWVLAARCPDCGDLIVMDEDHVVIPGGATVEDIKANPSIIEYACSCGVLWNEDVRAEACRQGDWLCIKGENATRPESVGFLGPAFPLAEVPLAEIAVTILKARSGDTSAKRDLAHGIKAVDADETIVDRKEDQILRLRDDRPEGLVPSVPIAAITAVADMQKRGFWFKITAWGYGLEQESWLLRTGFVDSWDALRKLFYETEFRDVRGNRYVVTMRAIDSGGGESEDYVDISRTGEAYLFACANPGLVLFKGVRTMASPYILKTVDRLPGTNKPLPGAPQLYTLNSKHYKDTLAAKLMVDPNSPGAWHLHSGYSAEQQELLLRDPSVKLDHNLAELAKQMCVEGKDDKGGFWINPKRRANHLWDASYMELALVDIAQMKFWKQPSARPEQSGPRVLSHGV